MLVTFISSLNIALFGGIESDQIKLSLEPEAASIWCQQVKVGKQLAYKNRAVNIW